MKYIQTLARVTSDRIWKNKITDAYIPAECGLWNLSDNSKGLARTSPH